MASQVMTNSGHDDMIHDAVLDYYGRRLATCSSDKTIKIFEVEGESHRLVETLKGHDGAVWSVAWAHPKFGTLLASCSYTGQVLIHREAAANAWTLVHASTTHAASVNLVAWAPHETGCVLAAASSDGTVSVLEMTGVSSAGGGGAAAAAAAASGTGFADIAHFQAHALGANSVSWAPSLAPASLTASAAGNTQTTAARRFVTGGSDCLVKIWDFQATAQGQGDFACIHTLSGHTDWVRDVAWSPTVLRKSYIASASQDKTVRIWTSENGETWTSITLPPFDAVAWRVSWSLSGNVLAVSTGDNRVSLWKERLSGGWECVKTIED